MDNTSANDMTEWVIELDDDVVATLMREFELGPISESGRHRLEEQFVASLKGMKIEIFSREHPPPHFRVSYQGESNNFDICTGKPLEGNALRKWFRNIQKWHELNRKRLIEVWNERRPSDCPVGKVDC